MELCPGSSPIIWILAAGIPGPGKLPVAVIFLYVSRPHTERLSEKTME
jgi:hypothetical protein